MNRKLKIIELASNFISIPPKIKKMPPGWMGAIESIINNIVNELIKRKHKVTLFASGDSKTKAKLFSVTSSAFLNRKITPEKRYMIEKDCFLISRAIELQRKKQFDIIHSHLNVRSCFFAPFSNIPIVTTLHSPVTKNDLFILKYYSKRYPKKQYFVSISKHQQKSFKGVNIIGNVYHGINLNKTKFSNKKGEYLAFLGRIVPQKGLDIAVRAAKKLGLRLEIRGILPKKHQNYYDTEVKPFIDRKLIRPPILLSNHSDIYRFLSKAKVLLFPIRWKEPFGLVMIEAMACGTPVIAFDRGSVPEIIKDGITGFICKPNNLNSMVKAIKKIYQMPETEYKKMRYNCRKHVEENFSLEKMVDDYEKVYYEILKRTKKRANQSF